MNDTENKKWVIQTENGEFVSVGTFRDYEHFDSNVFMNEGRVWVIGASGKPLLVRASEIIYAYECEGKTL